MDRHKFVNTLIDKNTLLVGGNIFQLTCMHTASSDRHTPGLQYTAHCHRRQTDTLL